MMALRSSARAGGVVGALQAEEEVMVHKQQGSMPLAQEYTVIARSPEREIFTMEPGLVRLPSGRLLATFPWLDHRLKNLQLPHWFHLYISDDDGASWRPQGTRDLVIGMPFLHEDRLYVLGNRRGRRDIVIARSDDEGLTWTEETVLYTGHFWNCPTGTVIQEGTLYRALGGNKENGRETLVIAGDLSRDLLSKAAWRMSNRLPYPGTPPELVYGGNVKSGLWLEPNVVAVQGRLLVLSTVKIRSVEDRLTPNIAAVCALEDDGRDLVYRFLQYFPMAGAQLKFHIIFDETSQLFWRTMNLPSDPACLEDPRVIARGTKGGDRRILALSYSLDALNWITAGVIAMTPRPWEGFQYAAPLIAGADLLVISRTSIDGINQHDANRITLHRVKSFRALALSIKPERPS